MIKSLLTGAIVLPIIPSFLFAAEARKPNIVFILADDLNYTDLGCYGQTKIHTPNIDRLCNEGIKFSNAYSGCTVSAPSRSTLMQGLHTGHCTVRLNSFKNYRETLHAGDVTVAQLLRQAGYATGIFGKWGLANHNQEGVPGNMGFDVFYGFLNQQHAHCYYPQFLYNGNERVYYPENGTFYELKNYRGKLNYDSEGVLRIPSIPKTEDAKYALDEFSRNALRFVRENKDRPFFLYLPCTSPHGALVAPDLGEYKDKPWPLQFKIYASMVSRLDIEVGRLMDLIKELDLDENTVVFFASDNGTLTGKKDMPSEFFDSESPQRGGKGDLYSGSVHVPAVVRWKGKIAPGRTSDHVWAFWDFMPTALDIANVRQSVPTDGISILPTLLGLGKQQKHEFFYWEYQQEQAVRMGDYYGYRKLDGSFELYDLSSDPLQKKNLCNTHPQVVHGMIEVMEREHLPSLATPSPGESLGSFELRLKKAGKYPLPQNESNY